MLSFLLFLATASVIIGFIGTLATGHYQNWAGYMLVYGAIATVLFGLLKIVTLML